MKKLINLSKRIIDNAKKDVNPYLHYHYGTIHNVIIITFLSFISIMGFNLDNTTTSFICLLGCLPLLILFEIAQKKNGGTNTFKEQVFDVGRGYFTAMFLTPLIVLMISQ